MTATPTTPQKKKSQGPIRFEAIIPILILCVAVWAYTTLFIDSHVRSALEFLASRVHGAQVDVGSVKISFREPSLTINGLQVTDKENPAQNSVAIGKMRFALLWDALLRAKLVISESSITALAVNSPRKSPGEVYPVPPSKSEDKPSVTAQLKSELKAEAEARTKNNVLGDIASVLGGSDAADQLNEIRDQLQAEAKIKELQTTLNTKKSDWAKRMEELPKPEAAKAILEKIRATKIDTSNPAAAKSQLESIKADIAKVDEMVKAYQGGQKTLEKDISDFNNSLKEIDEATKKDLEALQNRLKIPSIDKDSITKSLLSKLLGDKLAKVTRFIDQAKAYLPDRSEKKTADKPEFVPHPRGSGRTYRFPVTTGYPLVWLKKAELSSKASPEGFTGDFAGQLMHITTDPNLIKLPASLDLSGNAPTQQIRDIKLKFVLDYRDDKGNADLDLAVGSHPLPEQVFTSGEDVQFAMLPSQASLRATAKFAGNELRARIEETIKDPQFKTGAKSPIVAEALESAAKRIKQLDMKIDLVGSFTHQKIGLDSNLGSELATGFQTHLKGKLDQARTKLKSFVDGRVGGEKLRLTGEYSKAQSSIGDLLKVKDGDFKNLQTELQKALKEKSGLDSDKTKKDLEKKAKDLFKKIKI